MKTVLLVASGDLRQSANEVCWPAQHAMEQSLARAVTKLGCKLVRAHPYKPDLQHGFIASQKEGMEVFSRIDPEAPLIVAEAVWQYSHHVLPGLISHRGPILTVANWSGQWPGLVGMLNLNGSLTKAGVRYSTLWSEDFTDAFFLGGLERWLRTGTCRHRLTHVHPFSAARVPKEAQAVARPIAEDLRRNKSIMGVFDEGCMGMFNAIIPDRLLFSTGVYKERLSQSALYYATTFVPDDDALAVYEWLQAKGLKFHFGRDEATELTENQVLAQCRLYVAALRLADDFGCEAIGIQYQQGLKDLLPASDLAEGLLNNASRPPVKNAAGQVIRRGAPLTHFNEADECAGLDGIFTSRVHRALRQPVENTLHDLRWGDWDRSGSTKDYVWVLLISGAAPAAHHIGGYRGSESYRQPPMYFRLGGGTLCGVAHPGEIVWSRIYVEDDRLKLDLGRGRVARLPKAETERRWKATCAEWPIMHAVTYGVSRDQMMARHKANHVHVAYANSAAEADLAAYAKAALANELGLEVNFCGTKADGAAF
ncbi:fucose isomerase [Opitutus sp. ER46]|uniref:fucose isomerase n=1 Tax=Opitutus sp. ER46 TaxID=2161864 RepID=UPI001E3C4F29|nr:fucose isomerase [Opitutus sp. ER46]